MPQPTKPSAALLATTLDSTADDTASRVVAIAPAALLTGEAEGDYAKLARRIVIASRPRDALEEYLLRDVIDLTWEILRLRRVKTGIVKNSMRAGVDAVLSTLGCPYPQRHPLTEKWAKGDKGARREVDAIIAKAGFSIDEVTAKTLEINIDVFERIDRLLASAEGRRNNALHEIDRHREAAGMGARRAVQEAEDVEFREVDAGEMSGRPAA